MEANSSDFEFRAPNPVKTRSCTDLTSDELGEPLSPMARLFHRPGNSLNIMGLVGSKTLIDPDHFKLGIASTFLVHPRFSSLQVTDKKEIGEVSAVNMRWMKTEVNIEQHVFFPKIDSNEIAKVGVDKFVENYTRDLTGVPLDMSKPLWDVHVLNLDKMTSQGAMAVALFRFHHSIGDGNSLMALFMSFTRKASDPTALPTAPFVSRKVKKDPPGGFKFAKCLSLLRLIWNTLVDTLNLLATAFFLNDTPNPLKGPNDAGQTPRRIIIKSVRLEDIKLVKNITKTTVNDVVMGVIEAGLCRYLNRRYGERNYNGHKVKNGKGSNNNLPLNLRFRTLMVFNIRPILGIEAVEKMMDKGSSARWGNQIGYVIYPFKIMMRHDNPLGYVYRAQLAMNMKKASLESHFSYYIGKLLLKTFGFKALMIHVMSYAGNMNFILSTDDEIIPNPQELCNDLERSLEVIKMAAIAKEKKEELNK